MLETVIRVDGFIGERYLFQIVNGRDNGETSGVFFRSRCNQSGQNPNSIKLALYKFLIASGIFSITLVMGGMLGLLVMTFANQLK